MLIDNGKCYCQSYLCKYHKDWFCEKCQLPIIGTYLCEEFEQEKNKEEEN